LAEHQKDKAWTAIGGFDAAVIAVINIELSKSLTAVSSK
jgi:hypothetical protein